MDEEGISEIFTFYDDETTRKKLTILSKWDTIIDDFRNPGDYGDRVEEYLKPGKKYKITIVEVE